LDNSRWQTMLTAAKRHNFDLVNIFNVNFPSGTQPEAVIGGGCRYRPELQR
jgi:hypothetical protein